MPEGPETHRIADELRDALVGAKLLRVSFINPALKRYERRLKGHAVMSVSAHGKALVTCIEGGLALYTHSQLFGFWRIDDGTPAPRNATKPRLVLQTADARAQLFAAPTIEVLDSAAIDEHPFLSKLGPDVVASGTGVRDIRRQLADPRFAEKPLAVLLLDQAFAAGMGNYLRSEVLHRAGLAPSRSPASLDATETTALAKALLAEPRASYRAKARTRGRHASAGYVFKVYEREGEPCRRDGTAIEQVRMAARRLYWCPACQH